MQALRLLSVIVLLVVGTEYSHAQNKSVSLTGHVVSIRKEAIPGTTIRVYRLRDSLQITGTVADATGAFALRNIPTFDTLRYQVSSLGFRSVSFRLHINQAAGMLDSVFLEDETTDLEEVVIREERPAVITHGDTVEYRAASFETIPFAEANELINQLPGLTRDPSGNLMFNGVKITKIVVNGQEYFGKDGQAALNTLPADVIEKIVVMNNQAVQPGSKPEDEKVLDIQLKKGIRKFGNALAGAGSDERYEAGGALNFLREKSQLAIQANANNTNGQGSITMLGAGNGLTRTTGGGLNLNKQPTKKITFNASVGYNHAYTFQESIKSRTQFLIPDSSFFTDSNTGMVNESDNIGLHAGTSIRTDDTGEYSFSIPGLSFSSIRTQTTSSTRTLSESGTEINRLESRYRADGNSFSVPVAFQYLRRFSEHSILNVGVHASLSRQRSHDSNSASTLFHSSEDEDSVAQLNQEIILTDLSANYGINAALSFRIYKNFHFSITDNFSTRQAKNQRDTWNVDDAGDRVGRDTLYSNHFQTLSFNNIAKVSTEYRREKFSAALGVALNSFYSRQLDKTRDSILVQNQFNASPNVRLNYRFHPQNQIEVNYSAHVAPPTLRQLQPIANNTNPLFIQVGNPDLKPIFSQNVATSFQLYRESGTNISTSLGVRTVRNKIVQTIKVDQQGTQVSSYQNVDGVFALTGGFGYGMYFRKSKDAPDNAENVRPKPKRNFSFSVNTNVSYSQDRNFINDQLAANRSVQINSSASVNYSVGNNIGFTLSYGPAYTSARYEYAASNNQHFTNHALTTNVRLFVFKKLIFQNFVGVTHNASLPEDFTRTTTFWNFELSYVIWKQVELKFRTYDVLRQNQNLSRTVNQNYIESTQSNNLQQYFMFSIRYHVR